MAAPGVHVIRPHRLLKMSIFAMKASSLCVLLLLCVSLRYCGGADDAKAKLDGNEPIVTIEPADAELAAELDKQARAMYGDEYVDNAIQEAQQQQNLDNSHDENIDHNVKQMDQQGAEFNEPEQSLPDHEYEPPGGGDIPEELEQPKATEETLGLNEHPHVLPEIVADDFKHVVAQTNYVLAFIRHPECDMCDKMSAELMKVAQGLDFPDVVSVAVRSESLLKVYRAYHDRKYVTLFFRTHTAPIYVNERGNRTPEEVAFWLDSIRDVTTHHVLNEDSFEHDTQASTGATTGDWLVAFHKKHCLTQKHVISLDTIGAELKNKVNIALVDFEANSKLALRFQPDDCPTLMLFKQGRQYHYERKSYDYESIYTFVTNWHKHAKNKPVVPEPSPFDELTTRIALKLKDLMVNHSCCVRNAIMAVSVLLILAVVGCCFRRKRETDGALPRTKKD